MSRLSPAATHTRARTILEAMEAQQAWTYAIPHDAPREEVHNLLKLGGFVPVDDRWVQSAAWISLTDEDDLDVVILRANGVSAVPTMGQILELTGFFAQSELLLTAADIEDPEAGQALATLAHMVCSWDGTWHRLFALHLESPEWRESGIEALRVAGEQVEDEALAALIADTSEKSAG